jgi:acyl-CoA thioester hydrolase
VEGVAPFVAQVAVRWTDQDVYRHLNNAVAVTLLEEARVQLVFDAASAAGVTGFVDGVLVTELSVDYKRQIGFGSRLLRVAMTVDDVRGAAFWIRYAMHDGPEPDDAVAITAQTRMAAFDMAAQRPRRLTAPEREFLGRWVS